jgi:hypothetical protein
MWVIKYIFKMMTALQLSNKDMNYLEPTTKRRGNWETKVMDLVEPKK